MLYFYEVQGVIRQFSTHLFHLELKFKSLTKRTKFHFKASMIYICE